MEKDNIIIRNAIIHILDSTVGKPVLSDTLLDIGPDMNNFLREHIYKIISSDEMKDCTFDQKDSFVWEKLQTFQEENMISVSQIIAKRLYEIMNQNIDIPSADLIVVTYQVNSIMYLAFLKMNYKESYIHYIGADEDGNSNEIIKQKGMLPSHTTRLSEAVLINLSDYTIQLIEKKYNINGVKTNYLSELFLQCNTKLSSKSKLGAVTKAVEQIYKKYYEDDFDQYMKAKSILYNEYVEQGTINIKVIGEKLYAENAEIKEEFTEKIQKYNLANSEIQVQNKQIVKKFEKQFLKTDTGIEINIPMEEYIKKNVEIVANSDGTIAVVIKNINQILNK